jgi:predicted DNA-binding protein (MmcQ/YjbR family)
MIEKYFLDYGQKHAGVEKEYKEEWGAYLLKVAEKMFVLLGEDKEKKSIISLKCDPELAIQLRGEYDEIVPGYYLNKVHWNSIDLNGKLEKEKIEKLIDHSYELVFKSLTKKKQKEILENE